ncbi:hypothetical protein HI914_04819 [Erysiphe necator]|nr:hypothetical protein HI914_04819 [Erysiphe necator]
MNDNNDYNANKGPKVISIIIIFPSIALVAVILRLYTRIKLIHNQAIDDWIAVVALASTPMSYLFNPNFFQLFSVATSVFFALQVENGMGRHHRYLTHDQEVNFYKYLRVATNKKVRHACYLVMLFTIFYGIEAFFTGVFHCWPISRFWGETDTGKCINNPILWFLNAGLNITNDLLLLALPIFILKASTLPRKKKVGICLILSLGGFAAIVSIWRLYSLFIVSISKDISWDIAEMIIWSCIELNVGITCACVSTLKPLTSQFIPFIFRIWSSNSNRQNTSVRGARGSETELGPSLLESQKLEVENHIDRSKNLQGTSNDDLECKEKQSNCSRFKTSNPAKRNGLVFSQLPNHPALVVVGTHQYS